MVKDKVTNISLEEQGTKKFISNIPWQYLIGNNLNKLIENKLIVLEN